MINFILIKNNLQIKGKLDGNIIVITSTPACDTRIESKLVDSIIENFITKIKCNILSENMMRGKSKITLKYYEIMIN